MSESDRNAHSTRLVLGFVVVALLAAAAVFSVGPLTRRAARVRLEAEIARLRAEKRPVTLDEAWGPPPAPADDAGAVLAKVRAELDLVHDTDLWKEDWLQAVRREDASLDALVARALAPSTSTTDLLSRVLRQSDEGEAPEPELEPALRVPLLAAYVRHRAAALDACREASRRTKWWRASSGGSAPTGSSTWIALPAAHLVQLAALSAAENGHVEQAVADLRVLLGLARALASQPDYFACAMQQNVELRAWSALRTLARRGQLAGIEPLALDLAAYDPWAPACRAIDGERAEHLAQCADWGLLGGGKVKGSFLGREWTGFVDGIESVRAIEWCTTRTPAATFADPRYASGASSSADASSPAAFAHGMLERAAVSANSIRLARAALCFPRGGADAVRAFLATQTDAFTDGPLSMRVEPDGAVVLWADGDARSGSAPTPWRVAPSKPK